MIETQRRETSGPCDSCGTTQLARALYVTRLTNKKAELGYGLPDLTLCIGCFLSWLVSLEQWQYTDDGRLLLASDPSPPA